MPVVAHAGGWDELLVIAVPIVLFLGWRVWERTRGAPEEEPLEEESSEEESPEGDERE